MPKDKPYFISAAEKNLLWKRMPYLALGLAFCGANENIILALPFGFDFYFQATPETIFTTVPYNVIVILAAMLFLGLLLYLMDKISTLSGSIYLNALSQRFFNKTFLAYNVQFYSMLMLYFIATILIQSLGIQALSDALTLKSALYAVYIQLITLITYSTLTVFPPIYACGAYALTTLFTIAICLISSRVNPNYLFLIKNSVPFLGILLLILGRPKTKIAQALLFEKNFHINSVFSKKRTLLYVVLSILSLLSMFQLFLNMKLLTPIANNVFNSSALIYMLNMELVGVIVVSWFIRWKEHTPLLLFMLVFSLLSIGTISQSVFIENNIPVFIIQLALSLAGPLYLALLSILIYKPKRVYATLAAALFLINSMGYLLGYSLWNLSLFTKDHLVSISQSYIPTLSVAGIITIILLQITPYIVARLSKLCYLLNLKPLRLNECSNLDKLQCLTPREKEILYLVQQGLKNIEISNKLQITESTLRVHLRNTYRKLNISGRQTLKTLPYNPSLNAENTP